MVRCLLALVAAALLQSAAPIYIPFEDRPANVDRISSKEWATWVAKRDAEIRGRLARGDEDSLVYLWLYGTSFTKQPRATEQELARLASPGKAQALLLQRLDDLLAAAAAPRAVERLQFARALLSRLGIDVRTEPGQEKARVFLVEARARVIAENERFRRAAETARGSSTAGQAASGYSTLFHDRGLSSDTRLTASFAVDRALAALAGAGRIETGGIRRAGIVGPGLDFTDKAEGYDFYPPQTIQPFALIDSLARLRLAPAAGLDLATLDLSPRVNAHLEAARERARSGRPYTLQLPLPSDDPKHDWQPDLTAYWQSFGGRVGKEVRAIPAPAGVSGVRVRAVAIDPAVVLRIVPYDLNIIVQRLPLQKKDDERFDLIVATNILVYYDALEQALALSNIASMLRPGGYFLTNYAVASSSSMEALPELTTLVFFDKQGNGDTIYCYRRAPQVR